MKKNLGKGIWFLAIGSVLSLVRFWIVPSISNAYHTHQVYVSQLTSNPRIHGAAATACHAKHPDLVTVVLWVDDGNSAETYRTNCQWEKGRMQPDGTFIMIDSDTEYVDFSIQKPGTLNQ